MNRRRAGSWLAALALAGCLYFFENGTGTRIVLGCLLILPLIPELRRAFFRWEEPEKIRKPAERKWAGIQPETYQPGDVRDYRPGDPVNRIHWKLSAKKNAVLIREWEPEEETEEAENAEAESGGTLCVKTLSEAQKQNRKKKALRVCLWMMAAAAALLFLIPEARHGTAALCNRLFEASEAVNAYVYERFPEKAGQSVTLAAVLLGITAGALLAVTVLTGSRAMASGITAGCAGAQIYFGLALPGWANVSLLMLWELCMLARPSGKRQAALLLALTLAVSLGITALWSGMDPATEEASERARDLLSRLTRQTAGEMAETPPGETETRHTHSQTRTDGDGEARAEREFRLVTIEEEQISMPHWIDYLKIVLFLLLAAALVTAPFLPFFLVNARRKKALEARKVYDAEDVSEAVRAMFQQTAAWLEATGNGAGNVPYRDWEDRLAKRISDAYAGRFRQGAEVFEEAQYSSHKMQETQRQQIRELLNETEETLTARADWKQKLRLKYREWLWI